MKQSRGIAGIIGFHPDLREYYQCSTCEKMNSG